jgi:hypothetical protein
MGLQLFAVFHKLSTVLNKLLQSCKRQSDQLICGRNVWRPSITWIWYIFNGWWFVSIPILKICWKSDVAKSKSESEHSPSLGKSRSVSRWCLLRRPGQAGYMRDGLKTRFLDQSLKPILQFHWIYPHPNQESGLLPSGRSTGQAGYQRALVTHPPSRLCRSVVSSRINVFVLLLVEFADFIVLRLIISRDGMPREEIERV